MKTLLEKAFNEAAKLPKEEQEALAEWLLQEIASERKWADKLSESPDELGTLADEALAELHTGKTKELDPDSL